jgi:hypothetical protein
MAHGVREKAIAAETTLKNSQKSKDSEVPYEEEYHQENNGVDDEEKQDLIEEL